MTLVLPILLFIAGIAFTLYPLLPGALFVLAGIISYGLLEGWSAFPYWFWMVQALLIALNFLADWVSSVLGIKRAGGSKQAIWGSAIGMLIGPFVMGPFGILAGPVVGAMAGELIRVQKAGQIARVGFASLIGFILGTLSKLVLVLLQIVLFAIRIW
ncbi:DUF456 domain-containing protein [Effusibacillus consociatus]|uniref:DUF456 domain-containing protein n=1 Tax=Effusibacillus consociatus TaxID=1117041 RepID=A0ABV9PWU0_9BACL